MRRLLPLLNVFVLTMVAVLSMPHAYLLADDPLRFETGRRFAPILGTLPGEVVAGDFNEDGHVDLLLAEVSVGDIQLYTGDGDGNLAYAGAVPAGNGPRQLAAADIDNDGHLDAVASTIIGGTQAVLLVAFGDGVGSFPVTTTISYPEFFFGDVELADIDGDQQLDVVVAIPGRHTLGVAMNDGTRGFGPLIETGVGTNTPFGLELREVTGDAALDAIVSHAIIGGGGITVLQGDGAGGFGSPTFVATGGQALDVATADWNDDGNLDLAVSHYDLHEVLLLDGDGNGSFANARALGEFLFQPSLMLTHDVDGDGIDDLGVLHQMSGGDRVALFEGDGAGSLATASSPVMGSNPSDFAIVDLDENGRQDIVAAGVQWVIALGTGNGAFGAGRAIELDTGRAQSIAIRDFDGDGHLDAAITRQGSADNLVIQKGNGRGGFRERFVTETGGAGGDIASADLNGDGFLDLVVTKQEADAVTVLLGTASGTFPTQVDFTVGFSPVRVIIEDFDGDQTLDLAVANSGNGCPFPDCTFDATVSILLGDGFGGFTSFSEFGQGDSLITNLVAGDFDNDGVMDIVVKGSALHVSLFLGNGDGTFFNAGLITRSGNNWSFAAGDFDDNGTLDLAVTEFRVLERGSVGIHFGNGDGTFQTPVLYEVDTEPRSVHAVDLNGDGVLDLAVGNSVRDLSKDPVSMLLGDGAGGFAEAVPFGLGDGIVGLASGDFDEDGQVDLIARTTIGTSALVLLNQTRSFALCRRGDVNAAAGAVTDVLLVNDSAGSGDERLVIVDASQPVRFHMAAPPSRPSGPSRFAVYATRGNPAPSLLSPQPFGLGTFCTQTFLTDVAPDGLLALWNNIGKEQFLGVPDLNSSPAPSDFLQTTIGTDVKLFLQGIIVDSASPGGRAAVTNGVFVDARMP